MQLRDRVVVVTGGASGIGAALCRRFAAEGARGVVVADLDAEGAERVAKEVGGLAVPTDVSQEPQVFALAARAEQHFGAIDLFCSNAGIGPGVGTGEDFAGGPFADDAAWAACWAVNVMASVYAARAVLPAMLARGEGGFLVTASAAGLLTDIGGHAYSTTKHAAVGFAEWLAIAYGDRGLQVACLCPQGVRTPLLERAAQANSAGHLLEQAIAPEDVAEAVVRGLADGRFLILPHPEVQGYAQRKAADPDRWLAGMRRLRQRMLGGSKPAATRPSPGSPPSPSRTGRPAS